MRRLYLATFQSRRVCSLLCCKLVADPD